MRGPPCASVDRSQPGRNCALHRRCECVRHGVEAGHAGSFAESPGGDQILPFVRSFYGSQSRGRGASHLAGRRVRADPLMPLLFSSGIHDALQASSQGLGSEHLMAFLDDVYVVTLPISVEGFWIAHRVAWHQKFSEHLLVTQTSLLPTCITKSESSDRH